MMLEIAVGDAYGAGFEYVPRWIIEKYNTLEGYRQHQKHKELVPGSYTDDTQMSIAIAELLISKEPWTPENIAGKFVEVFKRDQRKGYASQFYDFLQAVESGKEFLSRIKPDSDKSGAAMRAGPIGMLTDTEQVKEYATIQARLTHDTPDGINAAVAAALMPHYFIYNKGKKKDLPQYITSHVSGNWMNEWKGEVGAKGWMSVRAAITVVSQEHTLYNVLHRSIQFGGDVDTVAAIAMAAGSCSKEIKQNLPEVLIKNLENKTYGRDYLTKLDRQLKAEVRES